MKISKWLAIVLVVCFVGIAFAADELTQEKLEERKLALETEYQYLKTESEKLKAAKANLKTSQDKRLHNDRVEALNARVDAYEKNRRAFEQDVNSFNTSQKTIQEIPTTPQQNTPSSEQKTSPEDLEITAMRKRIQEQEAMLRVEYNQLMREKAELAASIEAAAKDEGEPVPPEAIREMNEKLEKYEAKRKALNKEVDEYNARVRSASSSESKTSSKD